MNVILLALFKNVSMAESFYLYMINIQKALRFASSQTRLRLFQQKR